MNKHGFKHVRKINDGRPKPYFARVWFAGEPLQIGGGHATAREAHEAAIRFKAEASTLSSQQRHTAQGE
jgi:hypothetical protein